MIVGHPRSDERRLGRLPHLGGVTVDMGGEVVGTFELVPPHDADLAVEGDHGRDVVGTDGRPGHREGSRDSPGPVVAHGPVDIDAITLGPGRPERPGGVLVDDEGLGLVVVDLNREPRVGDEAPGTRVVGVPQQPGRESGLGRD